MRPCNTASRDGLQEKTPIYCRQCPRDGNPLENTLHALMKSIKYSLQSGVFALALVVSPSTVESAVNATLIVEPVRNGEATSHPITILYKANVAIDLDSLGNDDLLVDGGSLFRPGKRLQPELEMADASADNGKEVSATYRLDRPAGGWASFDKPSVRISLQGLSVRDQDGNQANGKSLGELQIAIGTNPGRPIIAASLDTNAIPSRIAPSHTFQIVFSATANFEASAVENDIIEVKAREVLQEGGDILRVVTVPITLSSVEHNIDRNQVVVTYEITRPGTTWGTQDLTVNWVSDETNELSGELGSISIPEVGKATFQLIANAIDNPAREALRFQIVIDSAGRGVDLETLGDDDIQVGRQRTLFNPDAGPLLTTTFIAQALEPNGSLSITYEVQRPEEGWEVWEKNAVPVILRRAAILDDEGEPFLGQTIGELIIDLTLEPAPQQLDFEEWARDVADTLGVDDLESVDPDVDGDQVDNVVEYALARDPLNPESTSPLEPNLVYIDGVAHLELKYRLRTNGAGILAELEASVDGRDWDSIDEDHFEIVRNISRESQKAKDLTVRSAEPLRQSSYTLFRIHVSPVDAP